MVGGCFGCITTVSLVTFEITMSSLLDRQQWISDMKRTSRTKKDYYQEFVLATTSGLDFGRLDKTKHF
jgi:hypothetical protein